MPTKKRRVGFIPRGDVLNLINKLSFENNLSISKIINILVEEALHKRGIFNIKTGKVLNNENQIKMKNDGENLFNEFNNSLNIEKKLITETSDEFIDQEIYAKFLMFLQFQERMKKRN
tara:strand:+ start:673 stop:1026 length:354 start_codon:yes stop_codon:yes gene_type:complete